MTGAGEVRRAGVGMYSSTTPDPGRLARFWADLMQLPVMDAGPDLVMLGFDHQVGPVTWLFEREAGDAPSGRVDLDLDLDLDLSIDSEDDWDSLADRAERLGAERGSQHDEGGVRWIVMRDPDGNRFRVFAPRRARRSCGSAP